MIAPRANLLWLCGGGLLAAMLALAAPSLAPVAEAGACALVLAAVADAVAAGRALRGIAVELPPLARLTKGAAGQLEVRIANVSAVARAVRLGVPMPAELGCKEEDTPVLLPGGAKAATLALVCLPQRRGSYRLQRAYLGVTSPLGLWLRRRASDVQGEVRVYPNLSGERKRMAGLFLNRGGFGMHAQRQVGQGREFERLREYIHGDAYGEIHWKATAKRAKPVTKIFQLERTQEVYVLIDSSRLSARAADVPVDLVPPLGQALTEGEPADTVARTFGPRSGLAGRGQDARATRGRDAHATAGEQCQTALERFVTAAMMLGMVAERQGDLFGVLSFSDRVDRFVRARNGKDHYRACREAIYSLQPRRVSPDYAEVFSFVRMRLRRRALLVFLTDLDDPILAENFVKAVPLVARQNLLLATMIQPPGVARLFADGDEEDGAGVATVDDVYRRLVGQLRWNRLREMEKVLRQRGVGLHVVEAAGLCPALVSQYMSVKRRQLL